MFFVTLTWCFIMITCYHYKETLLYIFMSFSTQPKQNGLLFFLTTDVAEVFTVYIKLSYYIANQITFIYAYYQFFVFLSTGLYTYEYIYFKAIMVNLAVFWSMFFFALNSYIFPVSWSFFFKFQQFLSFQNLTFYFEAKLSEYLEFYISIFYICSIIFQIIVIFFIFLDLFKTNLIIIKKFRKIFYFLFLIFSTFLTPPEVTYQLAVSICILIIYELTIIFLIFKTEIVAFK